MTHVFVGGAQRSGTTLLATLLCAGPETNDYLGESSGVRAILEAYDFMRKRFDDEGVTHLKSRSVLDHYFRNTLESFFTLVMATHAPASRLVLKEPHMTLFFPHLFHLVPGVRFVMIKRDPRDVVVSMLKVGQRMAEAGKKHFYNENDVAEIARQIRGFYDPVFNVSAVNKRFADTVTWVQYEQLVTDPHAVLKQVRARTGLSLKGVDPMNPGKHRGDAEQVTGARRLAPWVTDIDAAGALSDKTVGSYREFLSPEDLRRVEMATGYLIKKFGYEFDTEEAAALAEQQETD